ncbi:MFS transporter [Jidongwangia harbinensis]|uniref:MFS transporter n=1 Tax=Jidongwangia harbinensis TaxID=2878561 RepID=UPI001CDA12D9|nr:MFS transporter [Jidongwangia harbinensis]MCA2219345.1 MFS transporter [Jidongwangia harbinensis]
MSDPPDTAIAGARVRYRFPLLLTGQTVSAFGDAFAVVAMPLLVLRLTGSAAQMGLVIGTSLVAQLIAGPFTGTLVDRLDRRRVMIACDWVQGILGAALPVAWWVLHPGPGTGLVLIYLVVVLSSVAGTCYRVAYRAVLPELVGRAALMTANARLATATEIAYGLGPAAAGIVVAAAGETVAIGINALSFAVSAVALHLLRTPGPAGPAEARGTGPRDRWAGLRFLWRHPLLRALSVTELCNSLLAAGVTTLFIYYLRHELGGTSVEVGVVLSLTSIGAVAAAFGAGPARRRFGFGRAWLGGVALSGLALLGAGCTGDLRLVAVLAVLFAAGNVGTIILSTSVRQELTPDRLLGRVTAAVTTAVLAVEALGSVTASSLADRNSAAVTFVVLGAAHVPLVIAGLWTPLGAGREHQPVPGSEPPGTVPALGEPPATAVRS